MKVLAFNGSPRVEGDKDILLPWTIKGMKEKGQGQEII
jgi:multimeric flavodoxin WrbA